MSKTEYSCSHCSKIVLKWPSQVRNPEDTTCSRECKIARQSIRQMGSRNANYKGGVHCNPSICVCGGQKDYRAEQCNRCRGNIEKYFAKGTPKRNSTLWRYIETFDLIPHTSCLWCGVGAEWNGKPLVLQLDHIDGDTTNNELTNLRVLCPNCHSQTETYASRNRRKW